MSELKKKVIIVGNHTCGNRGDSAILRGLIESLKSQAPHVELTLISRMPVSSEFLLGHEFELDELYTYHSKPHGLFGPLIQRFKVNIFPLLLIAHIRGWWPFPIPSHFRKQIDKLRNFDAVIQVGGSFFVDLYGKSQFDYALCSLIAKRPIYLLGHSAGPYSGRLYKFIARFVFNRVKQFAFREQISKSLSLELGVTESVMTDGADTAWLIPKSANNKGNIRQRYCTEEKPNIAITSRLLAPFDKRLGTTQAEYELHLAELADFLVQQGYHIVFCSSCTGIDSYNRDDRMVALSVQKKMHEKQSSTVVMDELNDLELAELFSYCSLTIGTRLHSAIISMNAGTPAIALNYEHKSKGILAQAGLPDSAVPIEKLLNGELKELALAQLRDENLTAKVSLAVKSEKAKAADMIKQFLNQLVN